MARRPFFGPERRRIKIARGRCSTITGATLTKFAGTLESVIVNGDGYRGWNTRRTSVDILKKIQVQRAYEALVHARATLADANPAAGSLEADLIARIDEATHPYYIK